MEKKPPANAEDARSAPGREDPLEKETATHSHILPWKNSTDRGAWWAAVHGFTKSWARLSTRNAHTHTHDVKITLKCDSSFPKPSGFPIWQHILSWKTYFCE